jgi:hypothetical protein
MFVELDIPSLNHEKLDSKKTLKSVLELKLFTLMLQSSFKI